MVSLIRTISSKYEGFLLTASLIDNTCTVQDLVSICFQEYKIINPVSRVSLYYFLFSKMNS